MFKGHLLSTTHAVLGLGAVLLGLSAPAAAQENPSGDTFSSGEIVVTARRQEERLQDVPQTINAIPAEQLEELQIRELADISNIVAGVSLTGGTMRMRGVEISVLSNGDQSVAAYWNDADTVPTLMFNAAYDFAQIEVLRGPQGTNRGVSAPSGAVTVRTRRPDLAVMDGYVQGTLHDHDGGAVEGAVSIPLIENVLGLRLAGQYRVDSGNGVQSIHNDTDPTEEATSGRISLRFQPNSRLDVNLAYQYTETYSESFTQVFGAGDGNAINPAIAPGDRLAVQDGVSINDASWELASINVDYQLGEDHTLHYVGGYSFADVQGNGGDFDTGNVLPGVALFTPPYPGNGDEYYMHEVRISSIPSPDRFLDYTAGVYFRNQDRYGDLFYFPVPLDGAFGGDLANPNFSAYDPRYVTSYRYIFPFEYQELSFFANATAHLSEATELTLGLRQLDSEFRTEITQGPGAALIAIDLGGFPCAFAGAVDSAYPGLCDLALPETLTTETAEIEDNKLLYAATLSHRFTPDFMVYGNIGTSYLRPGFSPGIVGELATSTNSQVRGLSYQDSQFSEGYELGFKWTLPEGRGRVNVAFWHQEIEGFVVNNSAQYLRTAGDLSTLNRQGFNYGVDATLDGVDLDVGFDITPDWDLSFLASYADGSAQGRIPCDTFDGMGNPTFNTDGLISFCEGGGVTSHAPLWNAVLISSYERPIGAGLDGFLRGQVNYYPDNEAAGNNFDIASYSLVNLYAGVQNNDAGWNLTLYVKNLFDDDSLINRSEALQNTVVAVSAPIAATSNYYTATVPAEREIGLTLRYAWGQ